MPLTPSASTALARALGSSPLPVGVVLDVGYTNGLAALRSLHRAGAPVIAVDHRAGALGFRSRGVVPIVAPDPAVDEAGFVAVLEDLAAACGRPGVIFPTHDGPLVAAARAARSITPLALPGSGWDIVGPLMTKAAQVDVARAAGVPIPETWMPRTESDARETAAVVTYPVILKPSVGITFKAVERVQVIEAANADELVAAWRRIDAHGDIALVQEIIPGGDDTLYTAGCLSIDGGRLAAVFCGRKLLQEPPGFGTCRIGEARYVPEIVGYARALLAESRFDGITQIEFKRHEGDGSYRLIEINLRTWQWHSLATRTGVDLVGLAYRHATGQTIPGFTSSGPENDGLRWIAAIPHIRAGLGRDEGLRSVVRPLLSRFEEPILSVRDPVPGARMAAGLALAPLLRLRASRRRA